MKNFLHDILARMKLFAKSVLSLTNYSFLQPRRSIQSFMYPCSVLHMDSPETLLHCHCHFLVTWTSWQNLKKLSHRWVNESGVPTLQLLIQWRHHPIEEATWEDYGLISGQFPSFHLEDNAYFQEGCTDKNPAPLKTYPRRKRGSGSIDEVLQMLGRVEQLYNRSS